MSNFPNFYFRKVRFRNFGKNSLKKCSPKVCFCFFWSAPWGGVRSRLSLSLSLFLFFPALSLSLSISRSRSRSRCRSHPLSLSLFIPLSLSLVIAHLVLVTVGAGSRATHFLFLGLRGPAAILFISRDTCSDSIAKFVRTCSCGVSHIYRAICCKMGYRTDVPV